MSSTLAFILLMEWYLFGYSLSVRHVQLWTEILFWGSFLAYFSSNGCHQDALFCHCELFLCPTVNCFGFHLLQITFHIYQRGFFWWFVKRPLFISNIDFGRCEVIVLNKRAFFSSSLPFSGWNATASSGFERRNFFSCIWDQHIQPGIVLDEQKDQRTLLAWSEKST